MPDENGNPLPGEVGHWRHRKDSAASKEKHGTTAVKDVLKPVEPNPEPNRIWLKEDIIALNRNKQEFILRKRKVKFTQKDRESDLVRKILKTNPDEVKDKE